MTTKLVLMMIFVMMVVVVLLLMLLLLMMVTSVFKDKGYNIEVLLSEKDDDRYPFDIVLKLFNAFLLKRHLLHNIDASII